MSKELKEKVTSEMVVSDMRPTFMQEVGQDDYGIGDLSKYIIPPRLKVIQKQSGKPYSDLFNVGDVVVAPQMTLLAEVEKLPSGKPSDFGSAFHFVPIFFYAEWVLWNPIELKGSQPAIRARTLNPKSNIAVRAKSGDLWFEKCPELPEKNCRYVEHLNYIVMPIHNQLNDVPCVLSFSKGAHKSGTTFNALIRMRKAPIYGCVFEGRTIYTSNNKGDWYSVEVQNPTDSRPMFVQDEATFNQFRALHLEYKKHHEEGILAANYDQDIEVEGVSSATSEF